MMSKTQHHKPMKALLTALALLLLAPSPSHAQDITTGLVGHWRLDETSGTTLHDSSGNDNNGSTSGGLDPSTDSITGRVGLGLDFEGTEHEIELLASNTIFPNDNAWTFSLWLNADTITTTNLDDRVFLAKRNVSASSAFILAVQNGELVFLYNDGSSNQTQTIAPINTGTWYHITVNYDGSSFRAYLDGALETTITDTFSGFSTGFAVIGGYSSTSGSGSSNEFDGQIDDVRVYDRVLSAADVAELYRSASGNMIFNTDNDTIQYHDDTEWIAAGPPKHKPNAVNFDGVNDRLSMATDLSGVSDSKISSGSYWFRTNTDKTATLLTNGSHEVVMWGGGNIRLSASSSLPATVYRLDVNSPSIPGNLQDGEWHHVIFSVDTSDTNKRHIIIDGIAQTISVTTYNDDFIDYTTGGFSLNSTTPPYELNGSLADVWFSTDQYLDLSDTNVLRAFIDANGNPVDLGSDGSKPTGTAPDIFLSGDTVDWHTNKGTGGGFTETGALTTAPSPREENYTWQQIGNDLNLSGGSRSITALNSTTIALLNGSGEELLTYSWDGTNWSQIGNTLSTSPSGTPAITALDSTTIAYIDTTNDELRTYSWDGTDWSQTGNSLDISPTGNPALTTLDSTTIAQIDSSGDELRTYSWNGTDWSQVGNALSIAASNQIITALDSTTIAYIDTTNDELRTYSWDGTDWSQVGNGLSILPDITDINALTTLDSTTIAFADRANDELKTYSWNGTDWSQTGTTFAITGATNTALTTLKNLTIAYVDTANDDLRTYGFAYCTTPSRPQGSIIFESANDQMQYCDGENWVPMGPAGNGGISCSNPSGDAGDLTYNNTHNVMQYCEGDTWIPIGKAAIDPCDSSPAIGTTCADGSIYAGLSPDGSVPMYTTPNDAAALPWNNGNTSGYVTTGLTSTTTGESNTAAIIAIDSDSITAGTQPHQAAQYCADLVAHGKTDWYMPARGETDILYDNRVAIGNFTTGSYISASEVDNNSPWRQFFSTGNFNNGANKGSSYLFRCVRKD